MSGRQLLLALALQLFVCLVSVYMLTFLVFTVLTPVHNFSFIFVLINFFIVPILVYVPPKQVIVSAAFLLIRCFEGLPSSSTIFSPYLVLCEFKSKFFFFHFPTFRITTACLGKWDEAENCSLGQPSQSLLGISEKNE